MTFQKKFSFVDINSIFAARFKLQLIDFKQFVK